MAIDSYRGVALCCLRDGRASVVVAVVVESWTGDATGRVRDVRQRPGSTGRAEHVRSVRHEGASVLRADWYERPRVRHVSPAVGRDVVVGAQHSGAMDR